MLKNPPANTGDLRVAGSIPWVGKISWRSEIWQPTPVSLPRESLGHRNLAGTVHRSHRVGHEWSWFSTHTGKIFCMVYNFWALTNAYGYAATVIIKIQNSEGTSTETVRVSLCSQPLSLPWQSLILPVPIGFAFLACHINEIIHYVIFLSLASFT